MICTHRGIILAQGQFGHSYTFWTMPILGAPILIFSKSHHRITLYIKSVCVKYQFLSTQEGWGSNLVHVVVEWPLGEKMGEKCTGSQWQEKWSSHEKKFYDWTYFLDEKQLDK